MDEQSRSIFEAVSDGLVIHEDGIIIAVNPQFELLIRYDSSELIGKSFLTLIADESKELVKERMRTRPGVPYEIEGIRGDGTRIPAEVVGRDHLHEGRTVRVVVVRDITERKRLEAELQEARELLEIKAERQLTAGNNYGLTFREFTVLHHLAEGVTDKEIGSRLGISALTVHKHVAAIRRKMDAASRTEVATRAMREGLID